MGILRELAEAQAASPKGYAKLECGCWAKLSRFDPCVYHRRELREELWHLMEDDVVCTDGCCDPS